ncbi:unnamed protein product [Victoria cruziana]
MLSSFHGLENEDPYHHLNEFLDICATVKIIHIEDDALRLQLFSFSLKEKAKYWFKSLPSSTMIATWDDLQKGETFHQVWLRMKELLWRYPHHQILRWQVLQEFYDGLTEVHRQTIDSSCGDSLMLKSKDDA